MPTIDYVTIRGFKSIAAIDKLALRPINLIIGPNGSGKSNFIQVFSVIRALADGRLDNYVALQGGADRLLHFGLKGTSEIRFEVVFDHSAIYQVILQAGETDQLVPFTQSFQASDQGPVADPLSAGWDRRAWTTALGVRFRERLSSWRVYHFHDTGASSPLKKTADLNDNESYRPDGANLAAYLYLLQQRHPSEFSFIVQTVRQVAPFLESFILRPDPLNGSKIRLEWRHTTSDAYFDVSSLSDGTLRFIALATLLLQPPELRPSVVLIDEPELGLHPYAISILASMIKQASVGTQVIVATQSPLLLDYFEPEDVLVTDRFKGGTVLRRLEPEPLRTWLEDYSLGQLWEKNEIGGRPSVE